jgi:hypothetical protein
MSYPVEPFVLKWLESIMCCAEAHSRGRHTAPSLTFRLPGMPLLERRATMSLLLALQADTSTFAAALPACANTALCLCSQDPHRRQVQSSAALHPAADLPVLLRAQWQHCLIQQYGTCRSDKTHDASRRWCGAAEMEVGEWRAASTRAAGGHCARDRDQFKGLGADPICCASPSHLFLALLRAENISSLALSPCADAALLEGSLQKVSQAGRAATLASAQNATPGMSDHHASSLWRRRGSADCPGQRRLPW